MYEDPKSVFTSKTFWGIVITLAAPLAAKYGFKIDAEGFVNDLAMFAGALFAVYGRVVASAPVNVTGVK